MTTIRWENTGHEEELYFERHLCIDGQYMQNWLVLPRRKKKEKQTYMHYSEQLHGPVNTYAEVLEVATVLEAKTMAEAKATIIAVVRML